ncbi:uncharacterized protein [Ptychodera flava]|uniref:uncharacterized protein n=1 Tax=Ptychodera flava TaxID=63121 RepID=UPI00396A3B5B
MVRVPGAGDSGRGRGRRGTVRPSVTAGRCTLSSSHRVEFAGLFRGNISSEGRLASSAGRVEQQNVSPAWESRSVPQTQGVQDVSAAVQLPLLQGQSVKIHPYLDDWLLRNKAKEILLEHLLLTWNTLLRLGFIPSVEKSSLTPSQDMVFVGMRLHSDRGIVSPTRDRIDRLLSLIRGILPQPSVPARVLLGIIGTMVSMIDIVPWARLRLRPIQLYLLSMWRPNRHAITYPIPVRPALRYHLLWWEDTENLQRGVSLKTVRPDKFLFTDASTTGWGAHLDDLYAAGQWTVAEGRRHINWLELQAVFLALQRFEVSVTNQSVLVNTDNSTVVAYINKMGGDEISHSLFPGVESIDVVQRPQCSSPSSASTGKRNHIADALLRIRLVQPQSGHYLRPL